LPVASRDGARPGAEPPALGWPGTLAIFGAGALLLLAATRVLIPHLAAAAAMELVLAWFIVAGLVVFAPLLGAAWLLLRREGQHGMRAAWRDRLRFRRMNGGDWAWGMGAIVLIAAFGAGIQVILHEVAGVTDMTPSFMTLEPLGPGRYWILLAWLPFWLLNIMGEEVLWRGVLLPRQQAALGTTAWVAHAAGWLLFHVAFGWQLLLVLVPIIVILPYVVQRRQNSWVGVLIHGGVNGPAFVAVALGIV
jgi:membrane protease YdiL (CAAX protease family)